jgi:cytochrome b561
VPLNPQLHSLLWRAHHYLAFAFFAVILMHVAAILFHKLIRNDGIFETMAPVLTHNKPE